MRSAAEGTVQSTCHISEASPGAESLASDAAPRQRSIETTLKKGSLSVKEEEASVHLGILRNPTKILDHAKNLLYFQFPNGVCKAY